MNASHICPRNAGASYHHNRRSGRHDRERDRDRDRERMERLERERERERERDRLHARERDMVHYDLNDDDLLNERSYGADFTSRSDRERGGGDRMAEPLERSGRLAVNDRGAHVTSHRHIEDSDLLREREPNSRYPGSSQPTQSSRRERDEYSPHKGGGNNRRVLNAM